MLTPERHTAFRWSAIVPGALVAALGAVLMFAALGKLDVAPVAGVDGLLAFVGWGPLLVVLRSAGLALQLLLHGSPHVALPSGIALVGIGAWLVGWGIVAGGIQHQPAPAQTPSDAARAPLYPPLANDRDFHWSTLLAYGGGILGSELVMLVIQTVFAGGVRMEASGESAPSTFQLAPTSAFAVALALGCVIAFVAGFLGASRSRRLSAPEATIGVFYLGLPIPILLTLIGFVPALQLGLGYRLREVVYLANLLGRPEIGYWLVYALLVLMLVLGITSGFVATGSGRVDLRTGFELFIARRHVSVFRPRFLLGLMAILIFGIVPPLLIYAIVRAAEAAVERTRIKQLGQRDPLQATLATNQWKLREQSPTEMMTALSVGGVGVGVMALIIVLSVMSGFEADLQKKILGTNAHVLVLKYTDQFPEYREAMTKIEKVRGVTGESPFIMNEVMVAAGSNISGTILEGIDPGTIGSVTDLPTNILPGGKLEWLDHPEKIEAGLEDSAANQDSGHLDPGHLTHDGKPIPDPEPVDEDEAAVLGHRGARSQAVIPGVLIGRELAASLKVQVGDRVNVVSPLGGELGPQGPLPKSRPFRVAGIFYTGMYEYDSKYVYVQLHEAENFFSQKGPTGIALKVGDIDDARRISRSVLDALDGYPYRTRDWGELNKNLFSALRLEKLVMGIILSIIVIVAAGLIVATVIMLVLEKRKEISVLKALGVSDGGIVKIFLAEGLQIGIAGGLLGLLAGLAWCVFIEKVGLKLDPEVYYIPSLPVKIEPLQTALAVIIAILVTYLGSIYPALKASRVEPVEGLKAE